MCVYLHVHINRQTHAIKSRTSSRKQNETKIENIKGKMGKIGE